MMVPFSIHFDSPGTVHVDIDISGRVHLSFMSDSQTELLRRLDQLGADVQSVRSQGAQIMSTLNDANVLLQSLNDATNELSDVVSKVVDTEALQLAELKKLRQQIADGSPVTQAQLDAMVASLTERRDTLSMVADHLKTIAADPNNPTPPLPTAA